MFRNLRRDGNSEEQLGNSVGDPQFRIQSHDSDALESREELEKIWAWKFLSGLFFYLTCVEVSVYRQYCIDVSSWKTRNS